MKIIIGILMTIMAFGISTTETQAYNRHWVQDSTEDQFKLTSDDINMTFSLTSTGTKSFFLNGWNQQFTNGFIIYDYDGSGSLDNGVLPNGYYEIESGVNARYQYLYIGSLEFKIYEYSYEFSVTHGTNDTLTIQWVGSGTNDPFMPSTSFVYDYGQSTNLEYITIFDNLYDGIIDFAAGVQVGLIDGFNDGRDYYAYEDNGSYYTATYWGNQRYQDGLSQGESNSLAIQNMIPGILGVMFAFFFQLASISVLGVTALDLIALLFGVGIVLSLIHI